MNMLPCTPVFHLSYLVVIVVVVVVVVIVVVVVLTCDLTRVCVHTLQRMPHNHGDHVKARKKKARLSHSRVSLRIRSPLSDRVRVSTAEPSLAQNRDISRHRHRTSECRKHGALPEVISQKNRTLPLATPGHRTLPETGVRTITSKLQVRIAIRGPTSHRQCVNTAGFVDGHMNMYPLPDAEKHFQMAISL